MCKLSGINVRKKEEGGLVCGQIENYSVESGWGCVNSRGFSRLIWLYLGNFNSKIMKNYLLLITALMLLVPKQINAQNNGAAAAVVGVAAIAAIGAIASIEEMEERTELKATEWLLANHPKFTSFNLKTFDFNGKKLKDMSSTSVISFKIQEFTPKMDPTLDGKKYVLFCFTSYGWVNEQGIDFNKLNWFLVDDAEWMKMMIAYTKVCSEEKDETKLEEILKAGVIENKGVKVKGKMKLPFYNLTGDAYLATDYNEDVKFIYNERSLCVFLKKTKNLVQMRKKTIIETHTFLFP